MTKFLVPLFIAVALLAFAPSISVADVRAESDALVAKVKEKVNRGATTEEALADEIKAFDALLAAHKDERTDDVAKLAYWKVLLYTEIIPNQLPKGIEMLKKIASDYPDTAVGRQAPRIIGGLEAQLKRAEAQKRVIGVPLQDFQAKDLEGQPLSIASRKGKVLLLDFWATICPPCVREMPNVVKTYEKYHDKGFEIIGISLDEDKDSLTTFIKEKGMTWPQICDGKGFEGQLPTQYGVDRMPTTFLLDKEGKLIDLDLRGDELEAAVSKALDEPAK